MPVMFVVLRSSPLMLQGVLLPQMYIIYASSQSFVRPHMSMTVVSGSTMIAA